MKSGMRTRCSFSTQPYSPPFQKVQYHLDEEGCFSIKNYNESKPFSNFFPGIAGLWGVPMWVFYVNRGQGIASFGIESKDKAILEFQPANKAYHLTPIQGFRTFLKIHQGTKLFYWEPFQRPSALSPYSCLQFMTITSHDLTIEDRNMTLGLGIRVRYFTLPEEPFAGLMRQVVITNESKKKYSLEVVDGLPAIVPYGLKDWLNKTMSRTTEAWITVDGLNQGIPYFHLLVEVADTPQVAHITEGHFFMSFDPSQKEASLLPPLVDPTCLFGSSCDWLVPENFLKTKKFRVPAKQKTCNRTPSAFVYHTFPLFPGKRRDIISLFGFAHNVRELLPIARRLRQKGMIEKKRQQNVQIISRLKNHAFTHSAFRAFDLYAQQTFLDNVLRGGVPISVATAKGPVTFHVFNRKHGDLERDYNFFLLAPTEFSQGNGNYRDVNQNRRNDVWFYPNLKQENILHFLNLIQADGYNPLIIRGVSFVVEDSLSRERLMRMCFKTPLRDELDRLLKKGFQPGELLSFLSKHRIKLKVSAHSFLSEVLGSAQKREGAEHGEGFWTDHWTYNLDLVESYLALYPEELHAMLLERKIFFTYLNNSIVLPREERFILTNRGVRQYQSVKNDQNEIRAEEKGYKLKTEYGHGDVYYLHLLGKYLCVIANKTATFDPSGIGIEMEADKPNWYDSLNGLPGLMGSSLSETLELKRACRFILESLEKCLIDDWQSILLYEELVTFIQGLLPLLSLEQDPLAYWNKANNIKEHYRQRVRFGIHGQEQNITVGEIRKFLQLVITKAEKALAAVRQPNGLFPTYFCHKITDFEVVEKVHGNNPFRVRPSRFRRRDLPLFLEGFVHALRVEEDKDRARALYRAIRKSPLFDRELKMYKVNADLSMESEEIGRTRIFPPGWLENESVWLHMEYKYLLELLRLGLYEEFYQSFQETLIPFQEATRYGRSILENSSFIVSSVHEDPSLHGQGFVARLSGSTAEFLHMWLLMNVGPQPFQWTPEGGLTLTLRPALPRWLFTKKERTLLLTDKDHKSKSVHLPKDTYAFHFLGSVLVVYHNAQRLDLGNLGSTRIPKIILTYTQAQPLVVITEATIPSPYAQDIRDHKVERIDVYFHP